MPPPRVGRFSKFGVHQKSQSMRWSAEEDLELRRAVATHGAQWSRIAAHLRTTASAARMRWGHLRKQVQQPPAAAPAVPGLQSLGLRHGHRKAWPPRGMSAHSRRDRDRSGGRPWDYFVERRGTPKAHNPTTRQLQLLRNWRLDPPPEPLLMCNLSTAESAVRRYLSATVSESELNDAVLSTQLDEETRDRLGLAYRPGETCHTLTSSNANLNWVCGTDGRRGFATREEVSHFMGHNPKLCCPALRRLVGSDYLAKCWLAESVHGRMAAECARVATMHLPAGALRTAGSLYSGACDALVTGFTHSGHPLERVFVADIDPMKLRVLSESFSPRVCYPSASQASTECPAVDLLTASPSCHEVSCANPTKDPEAAEHSVLGYTDEIVATAQRAAPLAIVIEQSVGLQTHYPELLRRSRAKLDTLPYHWFFLEADGPTLGSTHARTRLLWVGVRVDMYTPPSEGS